ncbi:hypothetical protein [Iodidimonas gelatinilytica]|uniref:hypothetical protein n=1 Tax=Iodidimonas gelatinilytica TaxID=1236966 RepID=UPI00123070EB|nr:hypothetical protein [Iodidimonas gelatinilytica]
MGTNGLVVKTRKKMNRMIVGLVLLLVVEFFVLGPMIGPFVFGLMIATFIGGLWLGNRLVDPLLEKGEEAILTAMTKDNGEDQNH